MFFIKCFFLISIFLGASQLTTDALAAPDKDKKESAKNTASKNAKDPKKPLKKDVAKKDASVKGKGVKAKEISKKDAPEKPAEALPVAHEKKEEGADDKDPNRQGQPHKLPLPRFVSLKSNAVNMHVGPGKNYPVEWRYVKQSLPVEVIAEFDHWRQIRDQQGTVGWVHKMLLTGKRYVVVQGKVANLYASSDFESNLIATVEPGVICKVGECLNTMCKVDIQGIKGWIKRDFLWGIYPNEQAF